MAVSIVMPRLGDFMTEGVVTKWHKSSGDHVERGDVVASVEAEKFNYDVEATDPGTLHIAAREGDTVAVDAPIGFLLSEGESPPEIQDPEELNPTVIPRAATRKTPLRQNTGDVIPSTPGARRLAAKLGIDLSEISPTGPRGRIVDADVRQHHEELGKPKDQNGKVPPGFPEPREIIPLQGMRRAIAKNMKESLSKTAQLSYYIDIDVTEAQSMRKSLSNDSGTPITMAAMITKACAEALSRVPSMNTILVNDNVMYFDEINIGIAVALDEGLIVPTIKNVQQLTLSEISSAIKELSTKASTGGLSSDDVLGGTFTISVLGVVDGFTPILNPPQNAIIGVGRNIQKPIVKNGEIVVRDMMTLSLTADHQVIDGAVAVSFMRRLQRVLERPANILG